MAIDFIGQLIMDNWRSEVRFNTPDTVGKIHTEGAGRKTSWGERHEELRAKQKPMGVLRFKVKGE